MLNSDGMKRGLNRRVHYLARFGLLFHADITLLSSSQGSKADSFLLITTFPSVYSPLPKCGCKAVTNSPNYTLKIT